MLLPQYLPIGKLQKFFEIFITLMFSFLMSEMFDKIVFNIFY